MTFHAKAMAGPWKKSSADQHFLLLGGALLVLGVVVFVATKDPYAFLLCFLALPVGLKYAERKDKAARMASIHAAFCLLDADCGGLPYRGVDAQLVHGITHALHMESWLCRTNDGRWFVCNFEMAGAAEVDKIHIEHLPDRKDRDA